MYKKQIRKPWETDETSFGMRMEQVSEKGYYHEIQKDKKQTLTTRPEPGMAVTLPPAAEQKQFMGYRGRFRKLKFPQFPFNFCNFKKQVSSMLSYTMPSIVSHGILSFFSFIFIPFLILIVQIYGLLCGKFI